LDDGEPIIRVTHRYPICRPLAYLLKRSYGKGYIIFSAMNLDYKFPEARYLLMNIFKHCFTFSHHSIPKIHDSQLGKIKAISRLFF